MFGSRWSKNWLVPVSRVAIGGHLVVGEFEVEHVEVLGHPLGTDGLGDHHDAALGEPVQHDLADGLAVRLGDAPTGSGW